MNVQLIIVVVYIALLFAISFYVKSRADKGSAEYLFAGRKLGPVLIAVNITGLAVGAASTVGVAENAYKVGMAAGWYNAAWSAGAIIMGLVAAGKLRAIFGNRVLGPDKPPVARVQTLFIRKIVVKIETKAPMARVRELLLQVQKEMIMEDRFKSLIVYYDVDPM